MTVKEMGGSGLLSRRPIRSHEYREFPAIAPDVWGGSVLFGCVGGPRGLLSVFSVGLDWPPYASAVRQASVGHLVAFVGEAANESFPPIICGDFNASADADEIRSLTGRRETVTPGFVLFDAWEMAGNGSGHTWARTNPGARTASGQAHRLYIRRPAAPQRRRSCLALFNRGRRTHRWGRSIRPLRCLRRAAVLARPLGL
jgi:endonuclease/exonuclease/phosphatase family metal-dependent hydrolase